MTTVNGPSFIFESDSDAGLYIPDCYAHLRAPRMYSVSIVTSEGVMTPQYTTAGSAGVDLRSNIPEFTLGPNHRVLVPTGIRLRIPLGFEAQVRPRSGLALKHGVTVLNSPGTIDSDYRGDVGVILINLGGIPFIVKQGDRIAQLVFARVETVTFVEVEHLDETERGSGGFGSTGVK